jgi:hypothetical protein
MSIRGWKLGWKGPIAVQRWQRRNINKSRAIPITGHGDQLMVKLFLYITP